MIEYDVVTPVNFDLLENRNYFTDVTVDRFGFEDVTGLVSPKAAQGTGK